MSNIAIKVDNVHKEFKLPHERISSVKNMFVNVFRGRRTYERQKVLNNISFEIKEGEFFGIVGRNGSGKSTLLKLLAGVYSPDKGGIHINGKLTPFIELGVGFNPELTGRENVFLNGALLGFSRKEMEAMYKEIVEFAELEKFMDQKLKNYSSGMQVRLAFSIAIRAKSEILILDEVLAVGDSAFQRKCYDYFTSLKKDNRTVVLVTHDMGAVRQYCDRGVMIENGVIVEQGDPETIAQAYQRLFSDKERSRGTTQESGTKTPSSSRWGEGGIKANEPIVTVTDEAVIVTTTYQAQKDLPPPIYGFTLYGPKGENILEANTLRAKQRTKKVENGKTIEISWRIPNIFASGVYSLSVACCDQSATRYYDWVNNATTFRIYKDTLTAGIVDPKIEITEIKDSL